MWDSHSVTIVAIVGVLFVVGGLYLARRRIRPLDDPAQIAIGTEQVATQRREWIFAQVWPKEHATPEELQALGEVLQAWRAEHPHVTRIGGLDDLLSGRYPPPDGPTPYEESPDGSWRPVPRFGQDGMKVEFRRMAIVDPWKYCPAIVWGDEGMNGEDAIGSLKRFLPPELVGGIGIDFG